MLQVLRGAGLRLDSRAYNWFILCVPPRREFAVERILGDAGFAVFVPARTEWRFSNRIARKRKQKKEITLALMPRYLFLGMSDATPGWHGALKFKVVTSIIHLDGKPYEVPGNAVSDMMWRHNNGKFRAPGMQKYMETRREFEVGDKVLTEDGLFEGRVQEITPPFARVLIKMLGSSREVMVDLANLVSAEYGGE